MEPEILEGRNSLRDRSGPDRCYVLYNHFLVIGLDLKKLDKCIAQLNVGRAYKRSNWACFVLDDDFEMWFQEQTNFIYFAGGGIGYRERAKTDGCKKIIAWLVPRLKELGYESIPGGVPLPKASLLGRGLANFAGFALFMLAICIWTNFARAAVWLTLLVLSVAASVSIYLTLKKIKQNLHQTVLCKGKNYANKLKIYKA